MTIKLRLYRATTALRAGKGIGATETFHVAALSDDDAMSIAEEHAEEGYKVLHLDCKGKVYLREK